MSEKISISTKIDPQLKQKFKVTAAQNNVKMGDLITQFIEEYVGETGSQDRNVSEGVSEEENAPQFPAFAGLIAANHHV